MMAEDIHAPEAPKGMIGRFMALPTDSVAKTVFVAVTLCLVASMVVSAVAVALRPAQEVNRLKDKQVNILQVAGVYEPGTDVLDAFGAFEPQVLEIATGEFTDQFDANTFDDRAAADALPEAAKIWISALQAGRLWTWIEGNHDPGPVEMGGTHLAELPLPPLTFRHIARIGQSGEISGHYHPKTTLHVRGRTITRPAFLIDVDRVIMPAYGTYTGGLRSHAPELQSIKREETVAVLTGPVPRAAPMPRQ